MDGGRRLLRSVSEAFALRPHAQPAYAGGGVAPARVLLRGERSSASLAAWAERFRRPAPRGVGLALALALIFRRDRVRRRARRRI